MPDLLERLYRTKLALAATVCTAAGLGIFAAAEWSHINWLSGNLVLVIGSTFYGTGLVSIVLEVFASRESDQLLEDKLRRVIRGEASTLRDSVFDALAARPEFSRAVSADTLDRIIEHALAARFGHAKKATDIYASIKRQVLNATQTRRDVHAFVSFTPWKQGPQTGLGAMFVATIRWQYRTDSLPRVLRFSAVNNQRRYNEIVEDSAAIETWFIRPIPGLVTPLADAYQLLECAIDEKPAAITHRGSNDAQLFTVTNPHANKPGEVLVTYTQRVLVPQAGHRLFLDCPAADGIRVDFTHSAECDIHQVGVIDYNSTGERARIHRSPDTVANPTISLTLDGWIFPHSGVVFTWTMRREIPPTMATD